MSPKNEGLAFDALKVKHHLTTSYESIVQVFIDLYLAL
jgi:hypothetical protein